MTSLNYILHSLHGINNWLALFAGIWTMGLVLPGLVSKRDFSSGEGRFVAVFTGTIYLQGLLGMALFLVMRTQGLLPFAGRSAVQGAHIGAGIVAAIFGTLAIILCQRLRTNRAKYLAAAMLCGLALLILGHLLAMLALLALLLLIQFAISKVRGRRSQVA